MNIDLSNSEVRSFYHLLQENLIDNRSPIGQKHELAFVITLFTISILTSYGQSSINKTRRNMVRNYDDLCISLHKPIKSCISRVQLSRILSDFDYESFIEIVNEYWVSNDDHNKTESDWYAVDGKELRGSIDSNTGFT